MASADDLYPQPTDDLLYLMLEAGRLASTLRLDDIAFRCRSRLDAAYVNQWPGEHYRFLAALTTVLEPSLVVEVGTFTGMSSLSIASRLGSDARLVTYDVLPWQEFRDTLFVPADFARIEQRLGDLSQDPFFADQLDTLARADVLFVDGPKDGTFEPAVFERLLGVLGSAPPLLILDDIRLPAMLQLWRDLALPKLDATSLGHWSGTGLAGSPTRRPIAA